MRVEFRHRDLRRLYEDPRFNGGFGPDVVRGYRKKVGLFAAAQSQLDLRALPSLRFEKLAGKRKGQYSVRVNDQWRIVLEMTSEAGVEVIEVVELVDYHD